MEEQIRKLHEQVKGEFPGYYVSVGLTYKEYEPPLEYLKTGINWHIKLTTNGEHKCLTCGHEAPKEIAVWCADSFDQAFAEIRELVKECEGKGEAA